MKSFDKAFTGVDLEHLERRFLDFISRRTIPGYGHFLRGQRHYDAGSYESAHKEFTRALVEDESYDRYWYYRGLCSYATSRYHSAERDLSKAVQIFPEYACAWVVLARTCLHLRKPDRARKCFDKAVRLDPEIASKLIAQGAV